FGPVSPSPGTSAFVSVAATPFTPSAGVTLMLATSACACFASTGHACSRRGKRFSKSSVYSASPVTCPRALSCGRAWPTVFIVLPAPVPPKIFRAAFAPLPDDIQRSRGDRSAAQSGPQPLLLLSQLRFHPTAVLLGPTLPLAPESASRPLHRRPHGRASPGHGHPGRRQMMLRSC